MESEEPQSTHIRQTNALITSLEKDNFSLKIKLHLLTSSFDGWHERDGDKVLNEVSLLKPNNR